MMTLAAMRHPVPNVSGEASQILLHGYGGSTKAIPNKDEELGVHTTAEPIPATVHTRI